MGKLPGKYKTYSPEFRGEAARLVVETSRPIADVARELGISETSLGNWVRAYREKHSEDEPPLQVSERAQPQPRRDRTSATGGGDESAGRKLIPRPAVEYPAQPALADPAHPA